MSVRLPLTTVLSSINNDEVGAGSVAGGVPLQFIIPQDTDNIVVKMTASTVGGAVSATLQTTDDGGTTWYDVARTSVVSNANNTTAQWLVGQVVGGGVATAISGSPAAGSILSVGIGNAAASTLASRQVSGLPVLSEVGRVFIRITGDLTSSSILTQVKVNSQSATA